MEEPWPCRVDSDRAETASWAAVRTRRKRGESTRAEQRQRGRGLPATRHASRPQSAQGLQNLPSYCRPECSTKNPQALPNIRKAPQLAGCLRAFAAEFARG